MTPEEHAERVQWAFDDDWDGKAIARAEEAPEDDE